MQPQRKDTIPRLHQLVPHMSELLARMMGQGRTFEELRRGYGETVTRLAAQGLGRQTASRVSDADAYWSPTAELLQEAMRVGFVERQPLPSGRLHLDAHRETTHRLTREGELAARLVTMEPARFRPYLAEHVIAAHPYVHAILLILEEAPLVFPEVREGEIESGRRERKDSQYWARWGAERINQHSDAEVTTPAAVMREIEQGLRKRFGAKPMPPPTSKAISEAMNDALAAASLHGRGLPIGATDLKVLKAWGSQLLLFDESRYVSRFADSNVVWLASDLTHEDDGRLLAKPRTFVDFGERVAHAIVASYQRQALTKATDLVTMPYLPIHEVRADAAFDCGVTRALVDIVLERVAGGAFPEVGARVWLHLVGGEMPRSEPVYRRGGTRRFSMTVTTTPKEEM